MDEVNTRWIVTSDEARRAFRHLLDSVLQERAHVTVTRYNTPVAVLVPIAWYEAAGGTLEDAQDISAADAAMDEPGPSVSPEDQEAGK